MLREFKQTNRFLSEDTLDEARTIYDRECAAHGGFNHRIPFERLTQMLHQMNIQLPDSMVKDCTACQAVYPIPTFDFNGFTNFIVRATLEEEYEQEMRNLFYHIDRSKTGSVDAEQLLAFMKQLEGGERISQEDTNGLMDEIDQIKLGYLTYESIVYLMLAR